MQKILVVCLGNICRSPLAEGILLHLVAERKLNIHIDSAGTSSFHIGEAPDKRTISNAKKHNIDLSPLRARQFVQEDFERFDKIYVMDKSNLSNVLQLTLDRNDQQKVDYLLNCSFPGKNMEVPDPYFGGEQGFEDVFNLVYKACEDLLDSIQN